jgi:copper(I)-binding protein
MRAPVRSRSAAAFWLIASFAMPAFVPTFAAAPPATPAAAAKSSAAATPKSATIDVRGAYARPTPPESAVAAAYLEIRASTADRLVGAATPIATRAEMHATTESGGVMRMRRVDAVPVKPGEPLAFAPGGLHLMLYGLSKPLVAGQRFPLELRFEKAGVVRTDVIVKPDDGDAGPHRH